MYLAHSCLLDYTIYNTFRFLLDPINKRNSMGSINNTTEPVNITKIAHFPVKFQELISFSKSMIFEFRTYFAKKFRTKNFLFFCSICSTRCISNFIFVPSSKKFLFLLFQSIFCVTLLIKYLLVRREKLKQPHQNYTSEGLMKCTILLDNFQIHSFLFINVIRA